MSVAASLREFWRLPGCGGNCTRREFRLPMNGRRFMVELHDPLDHENYGASRPAVCTTVLRAGPLLVDIPRGVVEVDGRLIELTKLERRLLEYLARRPGEVCSYGDIAVALYGSTEQAYGYDYIQAKRVLQVVLRLRQRLGASASRLRTFSGVGMQLAVESQL